MPTPQAIEATLKDGDILNRLMTAFGHRFETLTLLQKRRTLAVISLSSLGYSTQTADEILEEYAVLSVSMPVNLYHWINQLSEHGRLMITIVLAGEIQRSVTNK